MDTLRSSVRLPCDILVELGELTGYAWNSWELEPIICDAIRGYMRPPASNKHDETAAVANASTEAGHQWKQLFLPEGTRLRAAFGGEPYFAVVKGAEIRCGDRTVTPSGFANLQGSGNRNAWKAVWLRFPGNEQWCWPTSAGANKKSPSRACSAPPMTKMPPVGKKPPPALQTPAPRVTAGTKAARIASLANAISVMRRRAGDPIRTLC